MSDHHDEIWRAIPAEREPALLAERERFLRELISAGERVLDLGCGDGVLIPAIAGAGAEAVGADASAVALARAAGRGAAALHHVEPGEPLPFEPQSFDGVWMSEVLSQASDTGELLSEARRVLRPGGWLGVTVPFHGRAKNVAIAVAAFERHHDPESTTLRHYTPRSLRDQLERYGFGAVRLRSAGGLPLLRRSILAQAVRN